MRLLLKTPKVVVYDDVLPKDEFQLAWAYAQQEAYSTPLQSGTWIKTWRLGDGSPLGTQPYYASERPFNLPLDLVHARAEAAAKDHPEIVEPFREVVYRTYLYPRGCKLSWHDDSTVYCGAMTYYIHPRWGSTWGGELLVAEAPPLQAVFKDGIPSGPHLAHEWEDEYLNIYGTGHFITPKPNRMVLMAPGVYHSISRVDADAGDHPRCSVVGFFQRETRSQYLNTAGQIPTAESSRT